MYTVSLTGRGGGQNVAATILNAYNIYMFLPFGKPPPIPIPTTSLIQESAED